MSWFRKFLGVGKKEDTVLILKIRLNRWRHFLRTEWTCSRLLADLKEKYEGEYIFDRQYVFSTVGQLFQKAYQMTYDGLLLTEGRELGLYPKLDQLKENTETFLGCFSRAGTLPAPEKGAGTKEEPSPAAKDNLNQEPEFQMLKGAIDLLDPSEPNRRESFPETIEKIRDFRTVLRFSHEQVLNQFIKIEALKHLMATGLAFPLPDIMGLTWYGVDLGGRDGLGKPDPQELRPYAEGFSSSLSWSVFYQALSDSLTASSKKQKEEGRLFFLIVSRNSLLAYAVSREGTLIMDLVLTSVRELNHFFFRWQAGPVDSLFIRNLSQSWDWTDQKEDKVYELAVFQRPQLEIEKYLTQLGQGLAFW